MLVCFVLIWLFILWFFGMAYIEFFFSIDLVLVLLTFVRFSLVAFIVLV